MRNETFLQDANILRVDRPRFQFGLSGLTPCSLVSGYQLSEDSVGSAFSQYHVIIRATVLKSNTTGNNLRLSCLNVLGVDKPKLVPFSPDNYLCY
jgi:hypothetical protein